MCRVLLARPLLKHRGWKVYQTNPLNDNSLHGLEHDGILGGIRIDVFYVYSCEMGHVMGELVQ